MTSRWNSRGSVPGVLMVAAIGLPSGDPLIIGITASSRPRILRDDGYVTGGFGKWNMTPTTSKAPPRAPPSSASRPPRPYLLHRRRPEREGQLDELKGWLDVHNAVVMAVLFRASASTCWPRASRH
jgi:arylsulfatase A-like enzyme